jgi:hypothetical protein
MYEYDFVLMWRFLIEVEDILEKEEELIYPLMVESIGEAPDQYETQERYPIPVTDDDNDLIDVMRRHNEDVLLNGDEEEEEWDKDDAFDMYGLDDEDSY